MSVTPSPRLARGPVRSRRSSRGPVGSPGPTPSRRSTVDRSGIQQVTYEDLVAVGVDLAGVPSSALVVADPSGVVPIDVLGPTTVGPGTVIRFVGDPLDTLYSDTNVYRLWLTPQRVVGSSSTHP